MPCTASSVAPGARSTRRAVHWPECSMVEERAAAAATGGGRPNATIRFGPCVDAIMPGASSTLMAAARPRDPVNRNGVGGASAEAGSAAAAAVAARSSRCCAARSAEQKVKREGSKPCACSSACSSCAHRKGYCAVCERERTITGTPSSRLRQTFRHMSRKCEKLDTHGTSTTRRGICSWPACSDCHTKSFSRCSTALAWWASSISVTPSCLPKSSAWFATSAPACSPSIDASARRTADRRSRGVPTNSSACSMIVCISASLARS
mmetsp:Transcript_1952/g.6489  ORF Transcript_1952/g.6489 Transcript_1952/m.6489 type:complete len:265 (+) Transcript_1952:458-1252(+)